MEKKEERRKKNKKNTKYQILAAVCGIVFFCCAAWLISYDIGLRRAEEEMRDIMGTYVSQTENNTLPSGVGLPSEETSLPGELQENGEEEVPAVDLSLYGVTDRTIDFAALKEEVNEDIYAWLTVPGTVIDYPVLQHPEEPDYYLEYNIDGTKGRPGCIYTQLMNSKDWTDPNTVLYGHNMRVGTMFADLHLFEDPDFFEENRYIYIYTEDGRILVYEIFAAYAFNDAHLLLQFDFNTEEGYQSYLDGIRENDGLSDNFDYTRELTAQDRIITLSTCIRGKNNQRYLVQGVLTAEGLQPSGDSAGSGLQSAGGRS